MFCHTWSVIFIFYNCSRHKKYKTKIRNNSNNVIVVLLLRSHWPLNFFLTCTLRYDYFFFFFTYRREYCTVYTQIGDIFGYSIERTIFNTGHDDSVFDNLYRMSETGFHRRSLCCSSQYTFQYSNDCDLLCR